DVQIEREPRVSQSQVAAQKRLMKRWFLVPRGTGADENKQTKTMKTLHSLIAGLLPAFAILVRRIAFPLLFLSAGLMLVQPSAGQSETWTITGSLHNARAFHQATLLSNGKVLVAGGFPDTRRAELYDP